VSEEKVKGLKVGMKYFEKAMENIEPMTENDLKKYEKLSPNSMYG
jgi:SpoVK/Ycf46/Vps4 family AAA+-type ATPase